MAKTFSLSANIENGFAEGIQYLVTPNAQNAIHNIVNDFRTGIHSFTIIGSYGKGHGLEDYWFYLDDETNEWVMSKGTEAAMPMYYADTEIHKQFIEIAKEVFK